jgi:FkbM family methyltransferase
MPSLKNRVHQTLQRFGWDLHRYQPDCSLETYLSGFLKDLRVNCVFDVGARIGEYGRMLRSIGFQGRIVSFEPVSENFRTLELACSGDELWHAYPYALGSEVSESSINVTQGTNFSSFLSPNGFGRSRFPDEIDIDRKEAVSVQRLDAIFDEVTQSIHEPIAYLKMDTQGWDLKVLQGAERCLDRIVGAQSEMSLISIYERMPSAIEAMGAFEQAGFFPAALYPVSRDMYQRLIEFDCIMVRPHSLDFRVPNPDHSRARYEDCLDVASHRG